MNEQECAQHIIDSLGRNYVKSLLVQMFNDDQDQDCKIKLIIVVLTPRELTPSAQAVYHDNVLGYLIQFLKE